MSTQPEVRSAARRALVTGGAGYLGSTLVRWLGARGWQVAVLDDLSNGHADALPAGVPLHRGDVRDAAAVDAALALCGPRPDVIVHLAGLIQVGESVLQPERYLSVNVDGTQVVLAAARRAGVPAFVQASSAAVLATLPARAAGDAATTLDRLDESAPIGPESPYGLSKVRAEAALAAAVAETAGGGACLSGASLRLFNLAGSLYGCAERHEPETHLIPLALGAALGQRPPLLCFGDDFPTPDGTPLRDYVHIADVVAAFEAAALQALAASAAGTPRVEVYHLGSGVGRSVRDVVAAVERVVGRPVPHSFVPRRAGDCAALVADPSRLATVLGVTPDPDLGRMVRDAAVALGWSASSAV